jgi:DNA anti-recombination protein RmuC
MAANGTAGTKRTKSTATRKTGTQSAPAPEKTVVTYVRETAERSVDIPVGAALTVRDRVEEAVEPWTQGTSRERELKSLRTQVTRELNRFERRGGQARRKATQRARQTRNRIERGLKQRRRSVERTVKQNRTRVERSVRQNRAKVERSVKRNRDQVASAVKENRARVEGTLRKAQTAAQERVSV